MAVISHRPTIKTILDTKINMLLRITKSIKRGYSGESAVRVEPKEAARHLHGILISSGAHVMS
jgi:hypothetical protein